MHIFYDLTICTVNAIAFSTRWQNNIYEGYFITIIKTCQYKDRILKKHIDKIKKERYNLIKLNKIQIKAETKNVGQMRLMRESAGGVS